MSKQSGWLLELSEDVRRAVEADALLWGVSADVFAERILRTYLAEPLEARLPRTWDESGAAS
jgi:hypothetical protein